MEKFKKYIVLIIFMILPFAFLSFGIIHKGHHYMLLISALPILATLIRDKFISAFLIYAFIWQAFIFIYAMFIKIPASIVENGLMTVIFISAGAAVYAAVTRMKLENEKVYNFICIAAIIQTVMCYAQMWFSFDPVLWTISLALSAYPTLSKDAITGSMGNPNFVAGYLAISLPFFFRGKFCSLSSIIEYPFKPFYFESKKPQWWWAIPFIVFILWKSQTSAATVPAIIGVAVYLAMKYRDRLSVNKLYLIVGIGIAASLFYAFVIDYNIIYSWQTMKHNDRFDMWLIAINQTISTSFTTWFGIGPGAYWGKPYPLHSEWVQMFHDFGIIGLAILIGYVGTVLYKFRSNIILYSAFVIAVINMAGNYPLHLAPSAFLIIIIAGLIEREGKTKTGDG